MSDEECEGGCDKVPRVTSESVQDTRAAYEEWHSTIRSIPDEDLLASTWYSSVRRLLPERQGRVLEIACGAGAFARERARLGDQVVAADFSLEAIREARRRSVALASVPLFLVADAHRLPFRSAVFDTAISCETIEHLERPPVFAAELARVVRPAGRLCLTHPSYLNLLGLYRVWCILRGKPYYSGVELQPRENFLFWPLVRRLLARAGFKCERREGAVHIVPCPGRPMIWLKALDRNPMVARLFSPFALHISLLLRRSG